MNDLVESAIRRGREKKKKPAIFSTPDELSGVYRQVFAH